MEGSDTAQASSFVLTLPLIIHQLESIYPGIGQRIFNVYLWCALVAAPLPLAFLLSPQKSSCGVLRGSRVYGLANNKSDYDLLVVTHREEGPTTWNRVCVLLLLLLLLLLLYTHVPCLTPSACSAASASYVAQHPR